MMMMMRMMMMMMMTKLKKSMLQDKGNKTLNLQMEIKMQLRTRKGRHYNKNIICEALPSQPCFVLLCVFCMLLSKAMRGGGVAEHADRICIQANASASLWEPTCAV